MIKNNHEECTACGACLNICPKKCISFQEDNLGAIYPVVDTDKCINCGLCERSCHLLNNFFPTVSSDEVFAAYSLDPNIRSHSASGGIATSLYTFCLKNGIHTFGVTYTPYEKAKYLEIITENDIELCQNSKYVFSHLGDTYIRIRDYLNKGEKVLFIGIPCHVAGLLSFLNGRKENLITIDIICHGTCPETYLNQHIKAVSGKHHAEKTYFRDPSFGTHNFILSFYEDNVSYYHKDVHDVDTYQIGYHKAMIYRENCYNCRYARNERIGDLTISDFSGLGRIIPFDQPRIGVSCVICSTPKGKMLLDDLSEEKAIAIFKRPTDEAFLFEKQLNAPSIPHPERKTFIDKYIVSQGDFESSAKYALRKDINRNRMKKTLHIEQLKALGSKALPKRVKQKIKQFIR